jgi:hypothetical protein
MTPSINIGIAITYILNISTYNIDSESIETPLIKHDIHSYPPKIPIKIGIPHPGKNEKRNSPAQINQASRTAR